MKHVALNHGQRVVVWEDEAGLTHRHWRWWSAADWVRRANTRYRTARFF